ncbi:MAG TPA: spore protease YyaC [Alicyclobacillus sp.]|nr:spore protease YyaC [Alicyclobacillus sp.]
MRFLRQDEHLPRYPIRVAYNDPNAAGVLAQGVWDTVRLKARDSNVAIICVGTDRSTGDALGPLVGSRLVETLQSTEIQIFGTLDEPVHAVNLTETLTRLDRMSPAPFVIAVDACLGQVNSIGQISLHDGPLRPGAGVNKQLPPVGDIHITGIVNVGGYMEYFVLQNTRLQLVFRMARIIADGLAEGLDRRLRAGGEVLPFPVRRPAPGGP